MTINTQTADDGKGRFVVTMEIDSRMMLTANDLDHWAQDRGLSSFRELLRAPGFPTPTLSTAKLSMGKREWSAADVWLFMLRADGFMVYVDEGLLLDPSAPYMINFSIQKTD